MRALARTALEAGRLWPLALLVGACGCDRPQLLIDRPAPVFRGHQELYGAAGEGPLPWVLDRSGAIGMCLDAAPGADTSQWQARLFLAGAPAAATGYAPPAVRLDTTLCFETRVPAQAQDGRQRLCAELRDRFDATSQALPCLDFRLDSDASSLRALEQAIPGALATSRDQGGPVPRLDALSEEARARGFPALALRAQLIAAYTLRREGSEASRAAALRHLGDERSWIDVPAAARWAGQLAYERATLRLETNTDLAGCWTLLRAAERSFRSCGERKWIAVVAKQAEVLARAGALAEAEERLRFALAQCASAPCDRALVRAAENTLAWLVTTDPDAGTPELASSARALESILDGQEAPSDPLEHANLLLNLAFARERQGLAFEPLLARARGLLGAAASARARELAGWADLVEGRHALHVAGRSARAASICDHLGEAAESARLQALGASCAAAAYRRLDAPQRARDRLARALLLEARSGASALGQDVPLGPGQRAEDVYAMARAELEAGRGDGAWSLLRALDEEASASTEPELESWLETLQELERPSSATRRAQREAIRWSTLDRMQEAIRTLHGPKRWDAADAGVRFRAFPLDDEIVLLERTPAGPVRVYRRTPIARAQLVASIHAVREAIVGGEPDDARWIALVEPLAQALVPRPEGLSPVTSFAVHGILQEVPLSALPLPSRAATPRFLGEVTTVAWHPAGGSPRDLETAPHAEGAVFVVDPQGDLGLASAREAGSPATRVLWRDAATRAALRTALEARRWLHIDAHARYEPAFPELSTILLADGPVTGQELGAWASGLELANLSGCATGRSPVSADSGRFGLAGLLARHGVAWVVGSRAALSNALAKDFNRTFYTALAEGAEVPQAYRRALCDVRGRHPAARWAALVLLHAEPPEKEGQTAEPRTPSLVGDVR